jgi:hypothetical protein
VVTKSYTPDDQSIPDDVASSLARRDGSKPTVQGLSLTTNWTSVKTPYVSLLLTLSLCPTFIIDFYAAVDLQGQSTSLFEPPMSREPVVISIRRLKTSAGGTVGFIEGVQSLILSQELLMVRTNNFAMLILKLIFMH